MITAPFSQIDRELIGTPEEIEKKMESIKNANFMEKLNKPFEEIYDCGCLIEEGCGCEDYESDDNY